MKDEGQYRQYIMKMEGQEMENLVVQSCWEEETTVKLGGIRKWPAERKLRAYWDKNQNPPLVETGYPMKTAKLNFEHC